MTKTDTPLSKRPEFLREINSLINQPWAPEHQHCWSITKRVVTLLGYDLPPIIDVAPMGRKQAREIRIGLFRDHPERANWCFLEGSPDLWAVALMHHVNRPPTEIEHAGVFLNLDGGRILHSDVAHGVVFDTLIELTAIRRWQPIYLVPKA